MHTDILTPNCPRFWGATDSETIQATIAAAVADGSRQIAIPRYNARCDRDEWRTMKAIQIPSNFTVYLDNCYMVQETGSYDNMFTNEHSREKDYITKAENEGKNIAVIGKGLVVLDGGVHNRLLEKTVKRHGLPDLCNYNNIFFWNNVDGLVLQNVRIQHQRYWAINHIFCSNVTIKNIDFFTEPSVCNQDGIDMRNGCHDFHIENITGRTGDDTIACTALGNKSDYDSRVEGKCWDIYNMYIRNLKSDANTCYMLRLLNHDGRKIHEVTVDTMMEASDYAVWKYRNNAPFCVGSPIYFGRHQAEHGDTYNIRIDHLYSRSRMAMTLNHTLKDSTISDVKVFGDGLQVIGTWTETEEPGRMENVTLEHVWFSNLQKEIRVGKPYPPEKYIGTVVDLHTLAGDIKFKDFHIDKVGTGFHALGDIDINIEDFSCVNAYRFAVLGKNTKLTIDNEVIEHE